MPDSYTSFEAENLALKTHACYYREGRGVLRLAGKESIDFLQRLSTNDVDPLAEGALVTSVLTTEKAKVVDVCTFIPDSGQILAMTSPGRANAVKSWLQKYIIMEDITIEDLSSSLISVCLVNPEQDSFLSAILWSSAPIVPRKPYRFEFAGYSYLLYHDEAFSAPTYHLVASEEAFNAFAVQGVHKIPLQPVGRLAFESFRIEQGVPAVGRDIGDQTNPLEASLSRYISFTKGCYIGQEVIARIDTYKKLQKELRGLIIDANEALTLTPGSLWSAGEGVGSTTSHAWSFSLQRQIALGFVKTGAETGVLEYRPERGTGALPVKISTFPLC